MGEMEQHIFGGYDNNIHKEIIKELNRCEGHCCENIKLLISPDDLKNKNEQLASLFLYKYSKLYRHDTTKFKDNNFDNFYHIYYYECREYDKVGKVCKIYKNRPPICKSHPQPGNQ